MFRTRSVNDSEGDEGGVIGGILKGVATFASVRRARGTDIVSENEQVLRKHNPKVGGLLPGIGYGGGFPGPILRSTLTPQKQKNVGACIWQNIRALTFVEYPGLQNLL